MIDIDTHLTYTRFINNLISLDYIDMMHTPCIVLESTAVPCDPNGWSALKNRYDWISSFIPCLESESNSRTSRAWFYKKQCATSSGWCSKAALTHFFIPRAFGFHNTNALHRVQYACVCFSCSAQ